MPLRKRKVARYEIFYLLIMGTVCCGGWTLVSARKETLQVTGRTNKGTLEIFEDVC